MEKKMTRKVANPVRQIRYKAYFLFFVIGLVCFSCGEKETYYSFHELKNAGWSKSDTLHFEVDSSQIEPGILYSVTIELVHDASYPYRNLWLFVSNSIQNASSPKTDALQYELCNDYGKWFGAGFGSLYQLSLGYKDSVVFEEKRNYKFSVVQGMRDEPLKGIDKIGLKIERLGQ